ncbi:carbohydrate ABC transporter permease [Paenibacillus sp. 598K]|uniref:carbohydrate ABC transporter permease n=1 Tax=Paenibacillus sp. 598K TaxID=1117987 RepID=UPI000FFE9F19|nr:carbohydrate ABC transporter permease [Paenibacillus sp. 598K]
MERARIVEKGQRSLTITAYVVTIFFTLTALIPLLWMVSSAFKSDNEIDAYPPKWVPSIPRSIEVTLDYTGQPSVDRNAYELDAMEAIWYPWMKNLREGIGQVKIIGVREGKALYEATTTSAAFRTGQPVVVPSTLFNEGMMKLKLPYIQEQKLSKFKWYGEDGRAQASQTEGTESSELLRKFAGFYESTDLIDGRVLAMEERPVWLRMFDSFLSLHAIAADAVGALGFAKYFLNSAIVTLSSVLLQMLLGGLAGYALAHLMDSRRWQLFWVMFFLATIMIPDISLLLPLYLLMKDLGLVNSLWAIILPHSAWGIVIFLFKGFFEQVSKELLQAARVDGAAELRIFTQIVIPLSIPIFATVGVLTFIPVWNEFVWPLIVNNKPEYWTFTVALNDLQNKSNVQQNMIMASSFLSLLPLLLVFILAQKYIEKGVSFTGVKG